MTAVPPARRNIRTSVVHGREFVCDPRVARRHAVAGPWYAPAEYPAGPRTIKDSRIRSRRARLTQSRAWPQFISPERRVARGSWLCDTFSDDKDS